MVCASYREAEIDGTSLTDLEEEIIILVAEPNAPLVVGTY